METPTRTSCQLKVYLQAAHRLSVIYMLFLEVRSVISSIPSLPPNISSLFSLPLPPPLFPSPSHFLYLPRREVHKTLRAFVLLSHAVWQNTSSLNANIIIIGFLWYSAFPSSPPPPSLCFLHCIFRWFEEWVVMWGYTHVCGTSGNLLFSMQHLFSICSFLHICEYIHV